MKKVVLSVVVLLLGIQVFAQSNKEAADSKLRFGIALGPNYAHLYSKDPLPTNADIENGLGLKLGILMEYAISKYFAISPKAELSYNNSKLEFVNPDNSKITYTVNPVSLDFITHIIYKTNTGKLSPYLLIGPDYKIPLAKKSTSFNDFNTKPSMALDFGVGLGHNFKSFIFAPELRYSLGLGNISDDTALANLSLNTISLVFNIK